jgi:glucosamine 6-phosphate synthetase-like amidotransferase/phosphosugar isomerase protein
MRPSGVVRKIDTMCGIAGYSLEPGAGIARTLAAQALLAGIAERGADAVGYAHRATGSSTVVHKRRAGASALLGELSVPPDADEVLIHVRDYTKGHPTVEANNHPVRHGDVVGVHNGIIVNDEELFSRHGFERDAPGMSVDSEAIFALAEAFGSRARTLEELRGSMAAAWVDAREPGAVYVARGVGRPLWVGATSAGVFFASTKHALEVFESFTELPLEKQELDEGTLLRLEEGRETRRERFTPDHRFTETPLPAVRAPGERESCLRLLTALAALA